MTSSALRPSSRHLLVTGEPLIATRQWPTGGGREGGRERKWGGGGKNKEKVINTLSTQQSSFKMRNQPIT